MLDELAAKVSAVDAGAIVEITESRRVDWQYGRADVSAHRVGELTVTPPWLATNPGSPTEIVVEPAMAFGTGEHATTRGCLRLIQLAAPAGKRVVDLGTGSGVLAIAAAKLGATRVVGIELDPDAISNAEANVVLNRVSGSVTIIEGDATVLLPLLSPADVVLANILSSVIRELLDTIADSLSPAGMAILSGILADESIEMKRFITARGWQLHAEDLEDGWWSAIIAHQ